MQRESIWFQLEPHYVILLILVLNPEVNILKHLLLACYSTKVNLQVLLHCIF